MKHEDALKKIVEALKSDKPQTRYSQYGYDIYIPSLIRSNYDANEFCDVSRVFFAAAWELCRRGILRPGISCMGAQATDEGNGGAGFSVTPFGEKWLSEEDFDTFVPTEPERFGELLADCKLLFGPGYHERAQEAIRCYGAHAYLATCAMCGAAAESILLAIAIERTGDEAAILQGYQSRNGRLSLENEVFGQAKREIKSIMESMNGLLKHWRDEAAHGKSSKICETEAYLALQTLLRVSIQMSRYWSELTKT